MASRQFATFEVADQLFGVEVHTVQEVLSYNEYTPVPLAPHRCQPRPRGARWTTRQDQPLSLATLR